MKVFSAQASSGPPLPLEYYLQPRVERDLQHAAAPPSSYPPTSAFTTKVGGRTFFECIGDDRDFPQLATLLLGGVDVNTVRAGGQTALHAAAQAHSGGGKSKNALVMSFLVDNGADVNARTDGGETPLMTAVKAGNAAAVRLLMGRGAAPLEVDRAGRSCVFYAAHNPAMLQLLRGLVSGVPELAAQEQLLHEVCRTGGGSRFTVLYLAEQLGLDVNAAEVDRHARESGGDGSAVALGDARAGWTPLHYATQSGQLELVKALLLKGADPSKADARGETPLQLSQQVSGPAARAVRRLLVAYDAETSNVRRDRLLEEPPVTIWQYLNAGCLYHLMFSAVLPHTLFVGAALIIDRFWLLFLMFCVVVVCHFTITAKHATRPGRSIGGIGCVVGFVGMVMLLLRQQLGTAGSLPEGSPASSVFFHQVPMLLAAVVVLGLVVMLSNPGTVASTSGQRMAIYKQLASGVDVVAPEVLRSIDLVCMVKKPLRSWRCPHLGRVVLRYDHYCPWLASSIGGGNHRAFVALLACLVALLATLLHVALQFRHVRATAISHVKWSDRGLLLETVSDRLTYFYTMVGLPVALVYFSYQLALQLWLISRNVTWSDTAHPGECDWCFNLGSRTYSLFDAGWRSNMVYFFLRGNLHELAFKLPKISPRLALICRNYEMLNFIPGGHGHSHGGEHGHSHGAATHGNHHGHAHGEHGCGAREAVTVPAHAASTPSGGHEECHTAVGVGEMENSGTGPTQSAQDLMMLTQTLFQTAVRSGSADHLKPPPGLGLTVEEEELVLQRARSLFAHFQRLKTVNSSP